MDSSLSVMENYLMNEEFLIEPTCFSSAVELRYFLEKFGFYQGRFIGKFPSDWIKHVYQHLERLPDVEQLRIRTLMAKHKDHLIPTGQDFQPALSWLANAHQQKLQKRFHGVVAACPNEWNYPVALDIDEDYFKGGHDVRIAGKADNYVDIACRLLQMSHEIVLVDPYLRLERDECKKVLYAFLEKAQQGKCKSFVIWSRYEKAGFKTKEAYFEMLRRNYQVKLKKGARITVKLLCDDGSVEKIHARVMLSILGGLRFDHGFEDFKDNRMVDISILDKNTHNHYCKWYLDESHDFEIKERHVLEN